MMAVQKTSVILLLLVGLILAKGNEEGETCLVDGTCAGDETLNGGIDLDADDQEGFTGDEGCMDQHENCEFWAEHEECSKNPNYVNQYCKKSCHKCIDFGLEQHIREGHETEILEVIDDTTTYMRDVVMVDHKFEKVKFECKNRHEECSYWKVLGECEANPGYMDVKCAPACQTCEKILFETRCPIDPSLPDAWGPGDLNKMFEKITTEEEFEKYNPRILSRPALSIEQGDDSDTEDYQVGPWVVVLDEFITEEECETLIKLGHVEGYKRSSDVGKMKFDGSFESNINDGRTSNNAWCQHDCYEDPTAKRVMERIENITGIPEQNSEFLQLLKYEVGQYYKTHHDYIGHQLQRPQGVRLITVFLYLNDVEAGGGTDFPDLKLTVQPKRGSALIWPSVLDEDPNKKDGRTMHQALAVEKGTKFGANAWLHMRDFKTPNKNGCQ
mmetsp:Transcript_8247/g.12638  ORF Transcript_8247/g.12638 Transcript_8247/m.12638 type:complete len:442 (-) Transcript_8247:110-1435(-)